MKFIKLFIPLFAGLTIMAGVSRAQNGHIYSAIGTGTLGFSGDGGHASNADFNYTYGLAKDGAGNIYVGDELNYRIRKVDAVTGLVSTIAGTGTQGYSGDGGPAINADISGSFASMCADAAGNIYFFDAQNYYIRKIDGATGIISTIGGNGTNLNTGNGGLATSAGFDGISGLAVNSSNLYMTIASWNRIRKIDLNTGIVTLLAGNGTTGYTGDGGPATNAGLGTSFGIACDEANNVYASFYDHHVIRKIDGVTGIINTICGTGQSGIALNNVPAITAQLSSPWDIDFDLNGNLLIADLGNGRVRRIDAVSGNIINVAGFGTYTGSTDEGVPSLSARVDPRYLCVDGYNNIYISENSASLRKITVSAPGVNISADSFLVQAYHECNNTQFVAVLPPYHSADSIKTFYGDGHDDTHPFVTRMYGTTSVFDYHYALSGAYPVKHVLYNGGSAIDSVSYTLQYSLCRAVTAKLYLDGNSDCNYDAMNESYLSQAATIAVDSNNIAVDTISAMGGFTYNTFGDTGDVYTFTILDLPLGLQASCPVNGIITDTIQSNIYSSTRYIGTECGTGSAFDLSVYANVVATGNSSEADIILHNTYCNPQNATLTMTYSPKYQYVSAYPAPTTQSGNVVTWVLNANDFANYLAYLHVSFVEANSQIVTPGDTIQTTFTLTPTTGDVNPANNAITLVDTVTGPYDPNAVYVSPEGCITPGTTLQYTVTFENMGNDTAHSIYVMDTLNNNVDLQSLQVISSSHTVNVTKVNSGAYNILKFEFPGINLPDSSHHDQCHGMVKYSINSKSTMSLTDVITNKAGIYFDYMPAVLTNVAQTSVCQPQSVNTIAMAGGEVLIFPNPAYSELTVQGDKHTRSCTVFNQAGQVMIQQNISNGKTTLNIKSLAAGVYFVNVKSDKGSQMYKFVKM